jgi:YgiT-type zinc finger domain-containing protein
MLCFQCKGNTAQKQKTYAVTLEKSVIIIKNVPAHVCTQCGEAYYSDEVMQKLEIITDRLENLVREVAIVDYFDNYLSAV